MDGQFITVLIDLETNLPHFTIDHFFWDTLYEFTNHKLAQLCSSCRYSFPPWLKFAKVAELIICFSCSRNLTWKIKRKHYWKKIQLIRLKLSLLDISWLGWNTLHSLNLRSSIERFLKWPPNISFWCDSLNFINLNTSLSS